MSADSLLPTEESEYGDLFASPRSLWVFWGCLGAAAAPLLLSYLFDLWKIEHYGFFPFAYLLVGWLAYSRWDRVLRLPQGLLNWSFILIGVVAVGSGVLLASPWLGTVGATSLIAAFFLAHRSKSQGSLIVLTLPLLLVIRPPLGLDQILVLKLQQITTTLSSVVLDLVGIPHTISNNVIELVSRELFVAEACSGVQSVFTLMFIGTVIVVLNRRISWLVFLYAAVSIVLAIFTNVLRVSTVAMADHFAGMDLATGWQHEIIGYVALLIGILFLLSFDQLVHTLMHPVDSKSGSGNVVIALWNLVVGERYDDDLDQEFVPDRINRQGGGSSLMLRVAVIAVCAVLALGSTVQAFKMRKAFSLFGSGEIIYVPSATMFDGHLQTLELTKHETTNQADNPRLGQNADIWFLKVGGIDMECQFVLSQPYHDWHELCVCYEVGNWNLMNREIKDDVDNDLQLTVDNQPESAYAVARFSRDNGQFAYLFYSAIKPSGEIVRPPELAGAFGRRFRGLVSDGAGSDVMMVQLFVVSENKIPTNVLGNLRGDFINMRDVLASAVQRDGNAK